MSYLFEGSYYSKCSVYLRNTVYIHTWLYKTRLTNWVYTSLISLQHVVYTLDNGQGLYEAKFVSIICNNLWDL